MDTPATYDYEEFSKNWVAAHRERVDYCCHDTRQEDGSYRHRGDEECHYVVRDFGADVWLKPESIYRREQAALFKPVIGICAPKPIEEKKATEVVVGAGKPAAKAAVAGKKMRRAAFTWFGYTDADVAYLKKVCPKTCDYLIVGFEICPETQRPHLQGYVEFKTPIAMSTIKSRLDPTKKGKSPIHVSIAQKVREANIIYCKKEETGNPVEVTVHGCKWFEIVHVMKKQGERSDIQLAVDAAQSGEHSLSEIANAYPEIALKYANGLKAIQECAEADSMFEAFKERYQNCTLRGWQKDFIGNVIGKPVDDRTVWWIWDKAGNTGKSWLSKYLVANHGAARFENAGTKDIAYAYKGEPVVIFDFARTSEERINYQIIEGLKNGCLFSAKYCSKTKYFNSPHIVCMANWPPNRAALSQDRWRVVRLDEPRPDEIIYDEE